MNTDNMIEPFSEGPDEPKPDDSILSSEYLAVLKADGFQHTNHTYTNEEISRLSESNYKQIRELSQAVEKLNHMNTRNWRYVLLAGVLMIALFISFCLVDANLRGAAYENGHQAGYQAGETAGYSRGYSEGETAGFASGFSSGYSEGESKGYESASIRVASIPQDAPVPESDGSESVPVSPLEPLLPTDGEAISNADVERSVPDNAAAPTDTQSESPNSSAAVPKEAQTESPPSSSATVYVSKSGVIHRISNCSGMKNYTEMDLNTALAAGYRTCSKCY